VPPELRLFPKPHDRLGAILTRTVATVTGVLALCWFGGNASSADDAIPDLNDPGVISAGHDLYLEKHCSHCHGATGEGGVNLVKRELSNPAYVFEAIADGRERGSLRMPAWRDVLSNQEIWQITAYVMSISRKSN
jgi:mono/diheme cytochrome c family protein